MNRCAKSTGLALLLVTLGIGCSHTLESKTISQWMDEWEREDVAQLRAKSSNKLDEKAFPLGQHAEPFEAAKVLNLPTGKIKVVKVIDADSEKKVVVEVGEKDKPKRELVFRLIPDVVTGKWVVDDVFQSERQRSGDMAYRSIAEQMNLLLSVQEFDSLWETGDREDVLNGCTDRLARLLSQLPPADFNRMLVAVRGGNGRSKGQFSPKARLAEDTAEVTLRKSDRTIIAAFRKNSGRWLVDDLAVKAGGRTRSEEDDITSVQDLTAVLIAANQFRTSYDNSDKDLLAEICTKELFEGALRLADLRAFPLPHSSEENVDDYDIKITNGQADFIVKGRDQVLQISLIRVDGETPTTPRTYRVDDVTVFEGKQRQVKRLTAVFTAYQAMKVFSEALIDRKLADLEFLSTRDLQQRVWERLDAKTIREIPLNDIPPQLPVIESTAFRGPLTEITVNQGGKPVTYVLRAFRGEMKVDDVLFPSVGRPDSLKETVELLIPIYNFIAGFEQQDLNLVAQNSSRGLNQEAWRQCKSFPSLMVSPAVHLRTPLRRVENTNPTNVEMLFGDEQFGAVVWLVKERDAYRIDDMRLIAGPDKMRDYVQLRRHVRTVLAEGQPSNKTPNAVVPADFNVVDEELFPETVGAEVPGQSSSDDDDTLSELDKEFGE